MLLKKLILTLNVVPFLLFVGCAGTAHKATDSENTKAAMEKAGEGQEANNSVALQAKAHNFVEIEFDQGSAVLTESAKTSLNSVIEQARTAGKIDKVLVFSWADEEYPSKNIKKLSKKQQELAADRNETIEKYVKGMRNVNVDTYSMAEQPNTLSKWFNTSDSKLKNSFIAAGIPTSATSHSQQHPNKASHAVILIQVE